MSGVIYLDSKINHKITQMNIVTINFSLKRLLPSLTLLLVFSLNLMAQEHDLVNGKKLFDANCAACHRLDKKLIGPPLKGISEKRTNEWLQAWIKDNNALRTSGDQDAIDIFEEYQGIPMLAYPQFTEKDINDILAYTDDKPIEAAAIADTPQKVDPMVAIGKKLFQTNCAACHKLDKKLIGPALGNIADKRSEEWLKSWIKDNNALRASGDQQAIDIFKEYNGMPMTSFPQLSDEDIIAIIAYTTAGDVKKVAIISNEDGLAKPITTSDWVSYVVTLVVLLLIVWVFVASNNGFLKIVSTIFILLLVGYVLFNSLMLIGIDQDYQPIQPIAFSHKIHAGDNSIDCQYCHSSAKHSKISGIPSVNVCMNCHKSISEYNGVTSSEKDKAFYDAEIQKIYDAIGWDSDKLAYIENYEQKPIKWVKVHNLPDFVYYNHSQHVTVAGLECQKCHGPVETMDELYQFSPLTMNWCLDCHKTTDVDLKGNDYYARIHEQLADKYGVDKVTIAQIGGKECGKCHY
jgi:mono/diheme cytochrome c family protein